MVTSRAVAPQGVAAPVANYALGVSTTHATRWLHTSGIVPVSPDGTVPSGAPAQADAIWHTVYALLHEADMTVEHVVSITTYVVAGNDLGPVMAARDEALKGHLCASTLVYVTQLAQPAWQVEIAIIAAA